MCAADRMSRYNGSEFYIVPVVNSAHAGRIKAHNRIARCCDKYNMLKGSRNNMRKQYTPAYGCMSTSSIEKCTISQTYKILSYNYEL